MQSGMEAAKPTYSLLSNTYQVYKFIVRMSVNNSLAHRIVLVITGSVPKTKPGIYGAVHAVLVQASAWLRLPPNEVSDRTKRVHPEPVSFPANI